MEPFPRIAGRPELPLREAVGQFLDDSEGQPRRGKEILSGRRFGGVLKQLPGCFQFCSISARDADASRVFMGPILSESVVQNYGRGARIFNGIQASA